MHFEFILLPKGGAILTFIRWRLLFLVFILFLTACQSNANVSEEVKEEDAQDEMKKEVGIEDKKFEVSKEVTEIEVLTWNGEVFESTIEDPELIAELVQALENAAINYTWTVSWAGPDYKLLFKNNEEVLYEIGYCEEVQNLGEGATGRYWEFDQLYKVDIELPLD